jgi:hypothetical protein
MAISKKATQKKVSSIKDILEIKDTINVISKNIDPLITKSLKNSTYYKDTIDCDRCLDRTTIYDAELGICIKRTSKRAEKLDKKMYFCDKYFEEKLDKKDLDILEFILDIEIYKGSNNRNIKIIDILPKNLAKTKKTAVFILTVLTLFINVPSVKTAIIDVLSKYLNNPENKSSIVIWGIREILIKFDLISYALKAKNFVILVYNIVRGIFTSSGFSDGISTALSVILLDEKISRVNGITPITIKIQDYNFLEPYIKDVLATHNLTEISSSLNTGLDLSKIGANTSEMFNTETKLNIEYSFDEINIIIGNIRFDKILTIGNEKGDFLVTVVNNNTIKERIISPLLNELYQIEKNFINDFNEIKKLQKGLNIILLFIKNKLEVEKDPEKKRSLKQQRDDELKKTNNNQINIHNALFNYKNLLKPGLITIVEKRIKNINITNWRSDPIFIREWLAIFKEYTKNKELNKVKFYNFDKMSVDISKIPEGTRIDKQEDVGALKEALRNTKEENATLRKQVEAQNELLEYNKKAKSTEIHLGHKYIQQQTVNIQPGAKGYAPMVQQGTSKTESNILENFSNVFSLTQEDSVKLVEDAKKTHRFKGSTSKGTLALPAPKTSKKSKKDIKIKLLEITKNYNKYLNKKGSKKPSLDNITKFIVKYNDPKFTLKNGSFKLKSSLKISTPKTSPRTSPKSSRTSPKTKSSSSKKSSSNDIDKLLNDADKQLNK